MTYINPISGTAMAAATQHEQLAADKSRQIRRQQNVTRNVAATDRFEPVVENAEAISPIHDEAPRQQDPKKKRSTKNADIEGLPNDEAHIDLVG
ncbi:MAG: hypothetical protein JWR85_3750 [Marmoricola sp.]|nr:hypothetical protein [Marmoricola sp.]